TTRGRGQLEGFHHRDPAIEAHAEPPTAEPARAQLPRQGRGGILCRLYDDVGQPVAAGEGHERESVVPQEDPDPWRPHASGSGRQERMVASRGAFRRPRCTTATTRLRTRPATRPSASIRNRLLPTSSPRRPNLPGTLGEGARARVCTTSAIAASERPSALSTSGEALLSFPVFTAAAVTSSPS